MPGRRPVGCKEMVTCRGSFHAAYSTSSGWPRSRACRKDVGRREPDPCWAHRHVPLEPPLVSAGRTGKRPNHRGESVARMFLDGPADLKISGNCSATTQSTYSRAACESITHLDIDVRGISALDHSD